MNMTQEEWEKEVRRSQAKAHAETFCLTHGIPTEAIEKVEDGYVFQIKFKF